MCGITLVFAPVMPILFFPCLVSLGCLYFVERLAMAYSYYKPPMYDETVNIFLLKLLAIAPFISYAPVALWAFSNQAVFRDSVVPIVNQNLYSDAPHEFFQFFE